jgi:hypothetical protein
MNRVPRTPEFSRRRGPINRGELDRLDELASQVERPDSDGYAEVEFGHALSVRGNASPPSVLVRITASDTSGYPNRYSFQELCALGPDVAPYPVPLLASRADGLRGFYTEPAGYASEAGGNLGVPADPVNGAIVRIWVADSGDHWLFSYPGPSQDGGVINWTNLTVNLLTVILNLTDVTVNVVTNWLINIDPGQTIDIDGDGTLILDAPTKLCDAVLLCCASETLSGTTLTGWTPANPRKAVQVLTAATGGTTITGIGRPTVLDENGDPVELLGVEWILVNDGADPITFVGDDGTLPSDLVLTPEYGGPMGGSVTLQKGDTLTVWDNRCTASPHWIVVDCTARVASAASITTDNVRQTSAYTVTTTMASTGLTHTFAAAGTYLLFATAYASINPNTLPADVQIELYDATTAATLLDGDQPTAVSGQVTSRDNRTISTLVKLATLAAGTVVQLRARKTNSTATAIIDAGSRLAWIKVA